jgi:hypothetical protein
MAPCDRFNVDDLRWSRHSRWDLQMTSRVYQILGKWYSKRPILIAQAVFDSANETIAVVCVVRTCHYTLAGVDARNAYVGRFERVRSTCSTSQLRIFVN